MTTVVIVIVALVLLAGLWWVLTRNAFVRARNKCDEAWSGVDVQLGRRHDLVPNLVATVKGYADHESGVLSRVTEARSAAISANGPREIARAESGLGRALGGVVALAESYPALRATESFQRLQAELAQIEDEIQASRRIYNANAQAYNSRIQVFPASLVAGGRFAARQYFEIADPADRATPEVAFPQPSPA